MPTSIELRKEKAAAIMDAKAIRDAAKAEERDLTDDQGAKLDELLEKAEVLEAQAVKGEQAAARMTRLDAADADLNKARPRKSAPEDPASAVVMGKEGWESDPNRGYRNPRAFLMDVMQVGMGHPISERLRPLRIEAVAGSDEAGGHADPYGGFMIPEGFSPDMLKLAPEADPMAGRTTNLPMDTPIVRIPARVDKDHSTSVSGGLVVYRRAQADTVNASRMKLQQIRMEANPLMGLSYATEELLTDSPISFVALLAQGFGDEMTSKIIAERLTGTGVGEYLGAMVSGCLVSVNKESGQAAKTLVYENIIKMRARIWGYQNAIWMANQDCLPQLITMVMQIGAAGVPIYHTSAKEDVSDTLLGRPIVYSEYMQTVGTKGDLLCANWTQYLEGVYQPLQGAESIHVRFVQNERAFRFTLRNAGAPWWNCPLTPKNSTATLSPFVTLNARA